MVSTERATSDIIIAVMEMNSANPGSGISPFFRTRITEQVKVVTQKKPYRLTIVAE